jgi:hypothetical protein
MNYQPPSEFDSRVKCDRQTWSFNRELLREIDKVALATADALSSPFVLGAPTEAQQYIDDVGRKFYGHMNSGKVEKRSRAAFQRREQKRAEAEDDKAAALRFRTQSDRVVVTAKQEHKPPGLKLFLLAMLLIAIVGDLASNTWSSASYLAGSIRLPDCAGDIPMSLLFCGFVALALIGVKELHRLWATDEGKLRYAKVTMITGLSLMLLTMLPLFGINFNPYYVALAGRATSGNIDWGQFDLGFWPSAALVIIHLLSTTIAGGGLAIIFERLAYEHKCTASIKNPLWTALDIQQQEMETRAETNDAAAAKEEDDLERLKSGEELFVAFFRGRVSHLFDCFAAERATKSRDLFDELMDQDGAPSFPLESASDPLSQPPTQH